jgi:hypothetical protein
MRPYPLIGEIIVPILADNGRTRAVSGGTRGEAMHCLSGGCYCGNILLDLYLTQELASYHPRACDCGFCRKHGAAYISDAHGSLRIRIKDQRRSGTYRQGSELAEMLLCTECGVLVGALYRTEAQIYATVNAKVIEGAAGFGPEQTVSPKSLSSAAKVSRWKELWFSSVELG